MRVIALVRLTLASVLGSQGSSKVYDVDGIRVTGNTYTSAGTAISKLRVRMGNAYYNPDFGTLLACLSDLVLSSLPPGGLPSAFQLPPASPLGADDAAMLSSDQFLTKLLSGDAGTML